MESPPIEQTIGTCIWLRELSIRSDLSQSGLYLCTHHRLKYDLRGVVRYRIWRLRAQSKHNWGSLLFYDLAAMVETCLFERQLTPDHLRTRRHHHQATCELAYGVCACEACQALCEAPHGRLRSARSTKWAGISFDRCRISSPILQLGPGSLVSVATHAKARAGGCPHGRREGLSISLPRLAGECFFDFSGVLCGATGLSAHSSVFCFRGGGSAEARAAGPWAAHVCGAKDGARHNVGS